MQTLSRPVEPRAPVHGSVLPRGRRRRVPLAVGAALAAVVCAVVFGLLYRSAGQRQWALVVVRDVPAGQVVTAADLAARQVSVDAGVAYVSVERRGDAIGHPAAVELVPGTLLSPRQLGEVRGLGASEAVVALSLPDGETPSLAAGDDVELVRTAVQGSAGTAEDGSVLAVARVVEVRRDASGRVAVSVAVDRQVAAGLASAAAANRVRVVRVAAP